jgi:hypothetical protein
MAFMRCLQWFGAAIVLHRDDDLAFGAPLSKIPERFSRLTQRVTSINGRDDFARCTQLRHEDQIFPVGLNRQDA